MILLFQIGESDNNDQQCRTGSHHGFPIEIAIAELRMGFQQKDRGLQETLQDDRGLVMAAVSNDGLALRFASKRLRGERPVAFQAVRQQGAALEFCGRSLLGDEELLGENWKN